MKLPRSFVTRCAAWLAAALIVGTASAGAAEKNFGDVRFVTAGPAMSMLPMEVVSVEGYDKEEGFAAKLTQSGGAIAVKAMIAGDFDIGMSAGSALAAAVSGAPVKIIYLHIAKPLYFLYGRAGIENVKGLAGARIGVDAIGGSQDVAVRLAMRASGADPGKIILLGMGFQNIPGSLIAGAIDAGIITPPLDFQLAKSGKKFTYLGFLGDYVPSVSGGLAATDRTIKERPDLLRAVLRAHAKAHRFVLEHRDAMIPIIAKFLNLTPEEAAKSYDTVIVYYSKTGSIPLDDQNKIIAAQAEALKIAKPPAAKAIFDFSLIGQ